MPAISRTVLFLPCLEHNGGTIKQTAMAQLQLISNMCHYRNGVGQGFVGIGIVEISVVHTFFSL